MNADLYKQLFKFINDRQLVVNVWRVPSHLLEEPTKELNTPIPAWVSSFHKLGNSHADRMAVSAAGSYELAVELVMPIKKVIQKTRDIQRRIAALSQTYLSDKYLRRPVLDRSALSHFQTWH